MALVLLVLGTLFTAERLGILSLFGDPSLLKASLLEMGGWGYVAFVVAYALLQPFGVPGTAFVVAAPLIWSWPVAFALSMTGTMAASCVGFSFARFIARDWVETRIPLRFRRYDDALAQRGFATVFLLRLIFWMPPVLHAFFGVSKVRFATHFWASFLGYLPPLFLVSYFGQKVFDQLADAPRETWIVLGAIALLVLGVALVRRRRSRAPTKPAA